LRLPGRFETKRALLGAINETVVYGLPEDFYETYPERIAALTQQEIEAAAREVVGPDSLVWIVVGDKQKIAAALDGLNFGELQFLSPDGEPISSK